MIVIETKYVNVMTVAKVTVYLDVNGKSEKVRS
jgi:hypothetical protein